MDKLLWHRSACDSSSLTASESVGDDGGGRVWLYIGGSVLGLTLIVLLCVSGGGVYYVHRKRQLHQQQQAVAQAGQELNNQNGAQAEQNV